MNDVFRYAISLALFLAATWLFKAATRLFSAAHGIAVARMPDCPCSRTSRKKWPRSRGHPVFSRPSRDGDV
jgi:hypothetical protein